MATITPVVRPSKRADGQKPLYLRISHRGTTRYVSISLHIDPADWNKNRRRVRKTHPDHVRVNGFLSDVESRAQSVVTELTTSSLSVTAERIQKGVKEYLDGTSETPGFVAYSEKLLEQYRSRDQYNTYIQYRSVLNKLKAFLRKERGKEQIPFDLIDADLLRRFITFQKVKRKNKKVTIKNALRVLHVFLGEAIKDGLFPKAKDPFARVKVQPKKKRKEKLLFEDVQSIEALGLEPGSMIWHVRNWFLFAFYVGGLRFSDVALLRGKHLQEEGERLRIVYDVEKTDDPDVLPLPKPALKILALYDADEKKGDDLIFNILEGYDLSSEEQRKKAISSRNRTTNRYLKKIQEQAEINTHITFHIARHSLAWHMVLQGKSAFEVQQILGHSSIRVTETYLKQLDRKHKDEIMDDLF